MLREAAELLGAGDGPAAMKAVRSAHRLLIDEIAPHETDEDRLLYPVIAEALGTTDPTGTMRRARTQIARLMPQRTMAVDRVGSGSPNTADVRDLQRL